jgi:hypothetical protein
MLTGLRNNLKRFAPERLQAAGISRLMHEISGTEEPWRMRHVHEGRETEYRMFFLCGFGKSGTNWVGNLLNRHPAVRCDGEFFFDTLHWGFDQFTQAEHQVGHQEPYRTVAAEGLYSMIRNVMLCMKRDNPEANVLGDRSPRELREILPGAPTMWLVRDGRDVVVSYTYHYLRLLPGYNMSFWPEDIRKLFEPFAERFRDVSTRDQIGVAGELLEQQRWVGFVSQQWGDRMLKDLAAKAKWNSPLLELRYELLHLDTEAQIGRMYRFLDLEASEASAPTLQSNTQAGFSKENPMSFYRKGVVGDWKNYDTPAFREAFDESAGDAAAQAGYGDWTDAA